MRRLLRVLNVLWVVASTSAAELSLNFTEADVNKTPKDFSSQIAGFGQPGDWRVVMDSSPPTGMPLSTNAPSQGSRPVLAQLSRSLVDSHYPIFVYEAGTFADFRFSTRFKIVSGETEQMAGIVFRLKDERNFYVLRASVKDGTLRFYRMNNGNIEQLIGPKIGFRLGEWRELAVECQGTQIRCFLDGQEAIPLLNDTGLPSGKIGFWTKSDSIAYFVDAKVRFTPRIPPAQDFVHDALQRYPRLVGLKIVMALSASAGTNIVASKEEGDVGKPGDPASLNVLQSGKFFVGKEQGVVHVTLPLKDRNGEPVAALKVSMESFAGQTEQNAVIRAQPVLKAIQSRVQSAKDLVE